MLMRDIVNEYRRSACPRRVGAKVDRDGQGTDVSSSIEE